MDRLNYVFDIASRYAPPDLYEEDGEICGDFPEVVTWFMGIVAGCHHYDFPCSFRQFCDNREIMDIVDAYNERIGSGGMQTSDGKKILQIDKEALYYGVMFVYYLTERKCTNAKRSPETVRQQLLNLRDSLSDARRFTLESERVVFGEMNGRSTQEYVRKEPVRIYGRALIANLVHCIDMLLQKDSLHCGFDSSGAGTGLEIPLDDAEFDLFATDDRVTYAPTRKAWIAMDMLKYLFGTMNLPDLRARKCLDVSEFDGQDEKSYSINRLIVLCLNLMRYTDSRNENFIKSLMSKYKNFDPNTMDGF